MLETFVYILLWLLAHNGYGASFLCPNDDFKKYFMNIFNSIKLLLYTLTIKGLEIVQVMKALLTTQMIFNFS